MEIGIFVNVKVNGNEMRKADFGKRKRVSAPLRLSGKRWPRRSGALQEVREGGKRR